MSNVAKIRVLEQKVDGLEKALIKMNEQVVGLSSLIYAIQSQKGTPAAKKTTKKKED